MAKEKMIIFYTRGYQWDKCEIIFSESLHEFKVAKQKRI